MIFFSYTSTQLDNVLSKRSLNLNQGPGEAAKPGGARQFFIPLTQSSHNVSHPEKGLCGLSP